MVVSIEIAIVFSILVITGCSFNTYHPPKRRCQVSRLHDKEAMEV
jgi:hypothetical protein